MKSSSIAAAIIVTFLLGGSVAWAHHAFAAEFDINQPVKLQGKSKRWNGLILTRGFMLMYRTPMEKS